MLPSLAHGSRSTAEGEERLTQRVNKAEGRRGREAGRERKGSGLSFVSQDTYFVSFSMATLFHVNISEIQMCPTIITSHMMDVMWLS